MELECKRGRLGERESTSVRTFSAQTLKAPLRQMDMIALCKDLGINILGMQEHQIVLDLKEIVVDNGEHGFQWHLIMAD